MAALARLAWPRRTLGLAVLSLGLLALGCAAPLVPAAPPVPPNYFCRPVTAKTEDGTELFGLFCIPQKALPTAYHRGQLIAYDLRRAASDEDCLPSWLALDPNSAGGYQFAVMIDDPAGHQVWDHTFTFPARARCQEARETVMTLQRKLLIPVLRVTACH